MARTTPPKRITTASPADGGPAGGGPAGGGPADGGPAGSEPAGSEPAGSEPAGSEPAGSGPSGGRPADRGHRPPPPTRPFDVDLAFERLREAVRDLPKAAMFQLAEEGFDSLFEQVVACIISIRTLEETTLPTARRLFAVARTPAALAALDPPEIDRLIGAATFHEPKARQIHAIAREALDRYGGVLPPDRDALLALWGVGPKCAALALSIAGGQEWIGVDIHVHRVTNRWGYVRGKTPEATMAALEVVLPRPYWVEINRLLVPFGKNVCTGTAPRCTACPLREMCQKVGVTSHR